MERLDEMMGTTFNFSGRLPEAFFLSLKNNRRLLGKSGTLPFFLFCG
jgi:hypothetical protein